MCLLYGPPGLGKTTLATIIANELNVNICTTSGPVIERRGDLAAILTNLKPNDVLFIDEIHPAAPFHRGILYPAMEDFYIDIMIGEGPGARSIKMLSLDSLWVGANNTSGTPHGSAARQVPASFIAWSFTAARTCESSCSSPPILWAWILTMRARSRSHPGAGGRRESPTGCSGACAITRR